MINRNAPYSGVASIMDMRDRNPNTQLAYVPNGYLNSVPTVSNPYTGIPQVNSPIAMNEGGMPSQQPYPMQKEASELADRGRYGDTTLVHMTPGEVQGLASLGQLTINPDTGLPEAFKLSSLLPIVANVGLAVATGGMSLPAQMAIMGAANFGMGLLQGQSAQQALLGGAFAAGTAGLMGGLSSAAGGAAGGAAGSSATQGVRAAAGPGMMALPTAGASTAGPAMMALSPAGTSTIAGAVAPATASQAQLAASQAAAYGYGGITGPATAPYIAPNVVTGPAAPIQTQFGVTPLAPGAQPRPAPPPAAPASTPSWFERNIYDSAANVGGKGEGFLEGIFSPNRSSLDPNAGMLAKYGPLGGAGLGALGLASAFGSERRRRRANNG